MENLIGYNALVNMDQVNGKYLQKKHYNWKEFKVIRMTHFKNYLKNAMMKLYWQLQNIISVIFSRIKKRYP
jgi:hypothetical protein